MDPTFEKLLNRMKEFEQTHTKIEMPEYRERIKNLYEDFKFIFDDCTATRVRIWCSRTLLLRRRG